MARRLRFKLSDSSTSVFPGEDSPTTSQASTVSGGDNSSGSIPEKLFQSASFLPSYSLLTEDPEICAIITDDVKQLHHFIRKQKIIPNDLLSKDGTPALLLATVFNNHSVMKILIDEGSDINAVTESGQYQGLSPLHMACTLGHTSAFNLLVNRGADITVKTSFSADDTHWRGQTCLHVAVRRNHSYLCNVIVSLCKDLVDSQDCHGFTPLHVAAMLGHLSLTRLLLRTGCDVNTRDNNDMTPIFRAIQCRQIPCILALAKKADLSLTCDLDYGRGLMPVHLASILGECQVVQELVDNGSHPLLPCEGVPVNVWHYQEEGLGAIQLAALHGNLGILEILNKYLIDHKGSDVPSSVLCLAVANNQYHVVQYLLACGCDANRPVNTARVKHCTALYIAVDMGHEDLAELLLLHKAKPDVQTLTKRGAKDLSPLHVACKRNHVSLVRLLATNDCIRLRDSKGMTPLHIAAVVGNCDIVELLLKAEHELALTVAKDRAVAFADLSDENAEFEANLKGPDSANNMKAPSKTLDKEGRLPIHLAAAKKHIAVIKTFLNFGFDLESLDASGRHLLHLAAADKTMLPVLFFLVARGGEMTPRDTFDYIPLHTAAENNNVRAVQVLLLSTVDGYVLKENDDLDNAFIRHMKGIKPDIGINLANSDGQTALHLAARGNHREVLEWLILAGADVNISDQNGLTPLHLASSMGNATVTQLIEAGADLEATCQWRKMKTYFRLLTPLHLTVLENEQSSCEMLIQKGADVNAICDSENLTTALHLALFTRHWNLVKPLVSNGINVNAACKDTTSGLMLALECQAPVYIVKHIVKAGADTNALIVKLNSEATPFEKTISVDVLSKRLPKLFLNWGANVNKRKSNGRTVLHDLVSKFANNNLSMSKFEDLLKLSQRLKESCQRVAENKIQEVLKPFLCDFSALDSTGDSILYTAAKGTNDQCLQLILKYWDSPCFETNNGDTVLHAAVQTGSPFKVRKLLESGVDVDDTLAWQRLIRSRNEDMLSLFCECTTELHAVFPLEQDTVFGNILHYTVLYSDERTLDVIISERLADLDGFDSLGRTPLYLALEKNKTIMALSLLSTGAAPQKALEYKDLNGRNLLHIAASLPNSLTASLLSLHVNDIDYKADNYEQEQDVTALHIAAISGRQEVAEILLRAGSDVNCLTANGKTACELAEEHGHTGLSQHIREYKQEDRQIRFLLRLSN